MERVSLRRLTHWGHPSFADHFIHELDRIVRLKAHFHFWGKQLAREAWRRVNRRRAIHWGKLYSLITRSGLLIRREVPYNYSWVLGDRTLEFPVLHFISLSSSCGIWGYTGTAVHAELWVTLGAVAEFNVSQIHLTQMYLTQRHPGEQQSPQLVAQNISCAKNCYHIGCDCWFVGIENKDGLCYRAK